MDRVHKKKLQKKSDCPDSFHGNRGTVRIYLRLRLVRRWFDRCRGDSGSKRRSAPGRCCTRTRQETGRLPHLLRMLPAKRQAAGLFQLASSGVVSGSIPASTPPTLNATGSPSASSERWTPVYPVDRTPRFVEFCAVVSTSAHGTGHTFSGRRLERSAEGA
jgi:hypothetical protein